MKSRDLRPPLATAPPARRVLGSAVLGFALAGTLACEQGPTGPAGPPGPGGGGVEPTPTEVDPADDAPAIEVSILAVEGASGPGGAFLPGDVLRVTFALAQADGTPWALGELTEGAALVSGPTINYQRVIGLQEDVIASSVDLGDGTWRYTFPPLPAAYLAPLNDSGSFGAEHGELTGQPLLSGTYTLGLSFTWDYTVDGAGYTRVGEATRDFLLGTGAGTLAPRQVVGQANCNACHVDLQAHGGRWHALALCLMCHTAGAEDANDPLVGAGTPGASIDSRVLFHKLHNAKHLPSVLGKSVDAAGKKTYGALPKPYQLATSAGELVDWSWVGFPAFPNRSIPMPKQLGYSALGAAQKLQEDEFRRGVSRCDACHGDPDGAGPIVAPAGGGLILAQPSRKACGSCHDDVDFTKPYVNSLGTMPPQPDDVGCNECHDSTFGGPLSVVGAHLHPLVDPGFDAGISVADLAVGEGPAGDGDGFLDPGETVALQFRVLLGPAALEISPLVLSGMRAVLSGPTWNSNLVHVADVPLGLPAGPAPHSILLPERVLYEHAGDSTAVLGDVFATARAQHDVFGGETRVHVRTASGAATVLADALPAGQNYLDVADASAFAHGDALVVDDGAPGFEEYLLVQHVDGARLWLSAPNLPDYPVSARLSHHSGTAVREVTLVEKQAFVDFQVDGAGGLVTELKEFGAGNAVLVSYTTDWIVPAGYPLALDDSPDLGESSGKWSGKSLVAGSYRLGLWGWRDLPFGIGGETTNYHAASRAAVAEVLLGDAAAPAVYELLDSGESCSSCHAELYFHDGLARGFDACILCHGTAGAEDQPQYAAANAPATTGTTVSFRTMVHRIHRGRDLEHAASIAVVASSQAPWPDNYAAKTYADYLYPALPGRTMQCAKCHGDANDAWKQPGDRDHPTEQGVPVAAWKAVCSACHDADAAVAHADANTAPSGAESCAICHGPGEAEDVELVHHAR